MKRWPLRHFKLIPRANQKLVNARRSCNALHHWRAETNNMLANQTSKTPARLSATKLASIVLVPSQGGSGAPRSHHATAIRAMWSARRRSRMRGNGPKQSLTHQANGAQRGPREFGLDLRETTTSVLGLPPGRPAAVVVDSGNSGILGLAPPNPPISSPIWWRCKASG